MKSNLLQVRCFNGPFCTPSGWTCHFVSDRWHEMGTQDDFAYSHFRTIRDLMLAGY